MGTEETCDKINSSSVEATRYLWERLPKKTNNKKNFLLFVGVEQPNETFDSHDFFFAGTEQAQQFVEYIPTIRRELVLDQKLIHAVSLGASRGNILWGPTTKMQSSSGAKNIFVTQEVKRTYDSFENQILVAALTKIYSSVPKSIQRTQADIVATKTAKAAHNLINTSPLNNVSRLPFSKLHFAIKKTTKSKKAKLYYPAIEILRTKNDMNKKETINDTVVEKIDEDMIEADTRGTHTLVYEIEKVLVTFGIMEKECEIVEQENFFQMGPLFFKGGPDGFVGYRQKVFKLEDSKVVAPFETKENTIMVSGRNQIVETIWSLNKS